MASMSREEAIKILEQDYKAVENSNMIVVARAYDVAISDMKKVVELEKENSCLKRDLEGLGDRLNHLRVGERDLGFEFARLEEENKRLRERVKELEKCNS